MLQFKTDSVCVEKKCCATYQYALTMLTSAVAEAGLMQEYPVKTELKNKSILKK